eukprot:GFYU01006033.1.p1 GENE.GFYU01006033.1~~GFYU01006033.1.p1  ORF type:complete len:240 (+),score=33.66 GFYU01006033.1:162-881(+)
MAVHLRNVYLASILVCMLAMFLLGASMGTPAWLVTVSERTNGPEETRMINLIGDVQEYSKVDGEERVYRTSCAHQDEAICKDYESTCKSLGNKDPECAPCMACYTANMVALALVVVALVFLFAAFIISIIGFKGKLKPKPDFALVAVVGSTLSVLCGLGAVIAYWYLVGRNTYDPIHYDGQYSMHLGYSYYFMLFGVAFTVPVCILTVQGRNIILQKTFFRDRRMSRRKRLVEMSMPLA